MNTMFDTIHNHGKSLRQPKNTNNCVCVSFITLLMVDGSKAKMCVKSMTGLLQKQ